MAWRCSGATNAELVQNLFTNGLITSVRVRDAMLRVDRAHFVPASMRHEAYRDSPVPIGYGATISAPHMHASAVEALLPWLTARLGAGAGPPRVLDVGSGSGYLTAVLAEVVAAAAAMVTEGNEMAKGTEDVNAHGDAASSSTLGRPGARRAKVVGVEHIQQLRDLGEANLRKSARGRDMLTGHANVKVEFVVGDGRKGWRDDDDGDDDGDNDGEDSDDALARGDGHGDPASRDARSSKPAWRGWDAIHVGAAAAKLHDALVEQLGRPGRMFIPIEDEKGDQDIWTIDKDVNGVVTKTKLYGVRYVPLTDAPGSA